ncbi:MAG: hypothetical protein KME04_08590 [Pleurocapsa minor GSE-CHR-MK-17-07R]|jgi:HTH-type transcriptional regulator/antitoxin HigA|nr:hypothetical protein [Pleurocapsa minor GSE-CHR-MK 17-07R]
MQVTISPEMYQQLVDWLDSLIDEAGEDEDHSFAPIIEAIGVLITRYEDAHVPEITDL